MNSIVPRIIFKHSGVVAIVTNKMIKIRITLEKKVQQILFASKLGDRCFGLGLGYNKMKLL